MPWTGTCFWLTACQELGLFKKKVNGLWVPCRTEDPEGLPDIQRLLRQCFWNRLEKRFERRRKVKG